MRPSPARARTQSAGPGPVLASAVDEPDEVEDAAVVAVVPAVVAVVPAVVAVVAAVVVVAAPVVSPWKRMFTEDESLAWSPKLITQVTPAACWAAVGGQGYLAASA